MRNLTTNKINIKRGQVRQGDTISPKLFTLAMKDIFKDQEWKRKGVNIDGKYLSHLRFADVIILMSSNPEELGNVIRELERTSKAVGLRMNLPKTNNKIISPDNIKMDWMD